MRTLLLLLVTSAAMTACDPAGYYVSKVYSANGQLLQERCEITYNHRPDPTSCHVEPVVSADAPQQPAYPPRPAQGYAPQPPDGH